MGTITVVSGFVPIYILLQLRLSRVYWGFISHLPRLIIQGSSLPRNNRFRWFFFVEVDGSKNPIKTPFQAEMDQTRSMLEIQQEDMGWLWEMGREQTGKWGKMMYLVVGNDPI